MASIPSSGMWMHSKSTVQESSSRSNSGRVSLMMLPTSPSIDILGFLGFAEGRRSTGAERGEV